MLFGRLLQDTERQAAIMELLAERGFEFPLERAVVATLLDRIMIAGADRACERDGGLGYCGRLRYCGSGRSAVASSLSRHGWLGEELPDGRQPARRHASSFAGVKDVR